MPARPIPPTCLPSLLPLNSACTDQEHAKCTVRAGQVGTGELLGWSKALASFPTCGVSTALEELNIMSCEPKGWDRKCEPAQSQQGKPQTGNLGTQEQCRLAWILARSPEL